MLLDQIQKPLTNSRGLSPLMAQFIRGQIRVAILYRNRAAEVALTEDRDTSRMFNQWINGQVQGRLEVLKELVWYKTQGFDV